MISSPPSMPPKIKPTLLILILIFLPLWINTTFVIREGFNEVGRWTEDDGSDETVYIENDKPKPRPVPVKKTQPKSLEAQTTAMREYHAAKDKNEKRNAYRDLWRGDVANAANVMYQLEWRVEDATEYESYYRSTPLKYSSRKDTYKGKLDDTKNEISKLLNTADVVRRVRTKFTNYTPPAAYKDVHKKMVTAFREADRGRNLVASEKYKEGLKVIEEFNKTYKELFDQYQKIELSG